MDAGSRASGRSLDSIALQEAPCGKVRYHARMQDPGTLDNLLAQPASSALRRTWTFCHRVVFLWNQTSLLWILFRHNERGI